MTVKITEAQRQEISFVLYKRIEECKNEVESCERRNDRFLPYWKNECSKVEELYELVSRSKGEGNALIQDGAFGKCPSCEATMNSELISEYNIRYCPYCGEHLDTTQYV